MSFYEAISSRYDEIFPLSENQKEFVRAWINKNDSAVLDIGCGTGDLVLSLADACAQITGIDLDASMIQKATEKTPLNLSNRVHFQTLNMLQAESTFQHGSMDAVFCMGNTLPHLSSLSEIESFISGILKLLKPGGNFIFQILNYGKMLKNGIFSLEPVEIPGMKFERSYEKTLDNKLDFVGKVTLSNGETHENRVALFPVTSKELSGILKGMKVEFEFFGSFQKAPFSEDSGLIIGKVSKNRQ